MPVILRPIISINRILTMINHLEGHEDENVFIRDQDAGPEQLASPNA